MMVARTNEEKAAHTAFVEDVFIGLKLEAVSYMKPEEMPARHSLTGVGAEQAESGVVMLDHDLGSRWVRWSQFGLLEGLCVGRGTPAPAADWIPNVRLESSDSWNHLLSQRIGGVHLGWHEPESGMELIWAIRFEIGDQSVVLALGEIEPRSRRLGYSPDCILVIHEDAIARGYQPLAARTPAFVPGHGAV